MWVLASDYKGSVLKAGAAAKKVATVSSHQRRCERRRFFLLVDAYVGADLGKVVGPLKGLSLTIQANNLTDKRYLAGSDGGSAFLGTPRTITGSLTLDF